MAVAHGSADPRASATIAELAAVARQRSPGLDLRTAFLGHAPPSLPQVLGTIEADREVTVLPLLLTAAYHSKADIPRVLARTPLRRVSYGATLGPHPLLLDALDRRLAESDPGAHREPSRTAVVLAAAGSRDPEANATIARMAARWQARAGWLAVRPAYASAAEPSPAAAVAGLLR
ncbi:MAG TPA: CbiX/SirB N-terminal domain-containing protein, partial [Streptosporangiaceae bacterium]|nr:CbiX/SirB N-terminal domain-containing protein [Streptosporangiaceae bacterium]